MEGEDVNILEYFSSNKGDTLEKKKESNLFNKVFDGTGKNNKNSVVSASGSMPSSKVAGAKFNRSKFLHLK